MAPLFLEVAAAFPFRGEVVLLSGTSRPITGYLDRAGAWTHLIDEAIVGAVDLDDGMRGVFLLESAVIEVLH